MVAGTGAEGSHLIHTQGTEEELECVKTITLKPIPSGGVLCVQTLITSLQTVPAGDQVFKYTSL